MNALAAAQEPTVQLSPQARMRAADPLGDRVHLALACAAGLAVASDTAPAEIAFLALVACFLARLPRIARHLGPFFGRALVWVLLAWAGYATLSLAWSPDVEQGGQELLRVRFFLLPILLYPVLDRARLVFLSILLGVALLHVAQALQVTELLPEALDGDRYVQTRYGGLMHPVASGNILVCAAALHLGALFATVPTSRDREGAVSEESAGADSSGNWRWPLLSLLGLLAALAGLLLTGSRGPWLAALALLPVQVFVTAVRLPRARKPALIVLALLLVAAAIGSIWLAPLAGERLRQARADLRQVSAEQDYSSHTGARLLMAELAWEMFTEKPLLGYGGGSYRTVAEQKAEDRLAETVEKPRSLVHGHAHNLYLHEAATRGVMGLALAVAVFITAIVTAAASVGAPTSPWRQGLPWAIAAMALCALFDHPLITHNCAFTTMLLFALSLAGSSRPRGSQESSGEGA